MKTLIISFIFSLTVFLCSGQYTVTLSLQAAAGAGCGSVTNCVTNTLCYDLYGLPSENGAWVASYEIWFVINGGTGTDVVYASDATCIIIDNNDFPPSPTTFIRVGASQGGPADVLNGNTRLHNFCIHFTTLAALYGSTIVVGGSVGSFDSGMSVELSGNPLDANLVTTMLTINSSNDPCLPLPVKWLSFNAVKQAQTSALSWTTEHQINAEGFIVERSGNGQSFLPIGQVSALSESTAIQNYFFLDEKPLNGSNYYRIKQFDFDGQYEYSETKSVYFDNNKFNVRAWPSPATNLLNIEVRSGTDEEVKIRLIDISGQVVLGKDINTQQNYTQLDISHLLPGIYNLSIEGSQDFYFEKIVVIN